MLPAPTLRNPTAGRFAANVVHFARLLRKAGMPVGTDRPLLALQALKVAGVASRADLYAVLRACLVDRIEHVGEHVDVAELGDLVADREEPPARRPKHGDQ